LRTSVRFLREERWASTRSWWPGGSQKAIDDNGGKYIAGGFNKTFSISGQPPADRVVILQFAHRGRGAGKRKSAAGTRPFENMDKVKARRTQNPTQKGFPAELIAQG
jgi:hypothetical protein